MHEDSHPTLVQETEGRVRVQYQDQLGIHSKTQSQKKKKIHDHIIKGEGEGCS